MQVHFFFLVNKITLRERKRLKAFVPTIFRRNNKKLQSINYIFCDDEYLFEINSRHLRHKYYTDIITFDLSSDPKQVNGEIYISVDRVRDNANKLKKTIQEELHRVVFHGALHLCGYMDKTASQKSEMRFQEDKLLKLYFRK